ncbi:MAG: tryptophan synthase subunit alpha [Candidatus Dormibacteria bacterium]
MASGQGRERLAAAFATGRDADRALLIGYVVAGDPDLETSALVIEALADAGLDVLELGIPYGDPIADGPTLAAAGQRSLEAGTRLHDCLDLAERAARRLPTILFTYYNPVLQAGLAQFAAAAAAAGACGVIVPDLSVEEAEPLRERLQAHDLALPLMVAPSTPPERARGIALASSGFVYLVSRLGVTGEATAPGVASLEARLATLGRPQGLPIAVGFGISSPDQVRRVAALADGVVVGSALVSSFAGAGGTAAAALASAYVGSLRPALERLNRVSATLPPSPGAAPGSA